MFSHDIRPRWWQLYLTFPLLIGLFILDARLRISTGGHQAVQIGIILLVYGLIHLWLRANRSALSKMDQEHYSRTFTVIHFPPAQMQAEVSKKQPMLDVPASETKGMLGNTFEVDYIDAKSYSIDEVLEESKKEQE